MNKLYARLFDPATLRSRGRRAGATAGRKCQGALRVQKSNQGPHGRYGAFVLPALLPPPRSRTYSRIVGISACGISACGVSAHTHRWLPGAFPGHPRLFMAGGCELDMAHWALALRPSVGGGDFFNTNWNVPRKTWLCQLMKWRPGAFIVFGALESSIFGDAEGQCAT